MVDVRIQTEEFLEEHPDTRADLRELLDTDAESRPWAFDDVSLDSGYFGEIVSRGIVEDDGDGYRLADRQAVTAALDGAPPEPDAEPADTDGASLSDVDLEAVDVLPTVDHRVAFALTGALVLVALFRSVSLPVVFRQGDVVLLFNDPYFYRYWADRLAAQATGPFDFGVLGSLPGGIARGEPLLATTLWWFTEVLGGNQSASGVVLALYPVPVTVISGVFVYFLSREVTDDPRVGVASVVTLAVTPIHANRTSLGFGDHHAFDYLWLSVTAVGLLFVLSSERELRDLKLWSGVAVLGVGVGAQTLAWDAGPLLLVPAGVVAVLAVLFDIRDGRSPARTGVPVSAGVGVGAVITLVAHTEFGWHTSLVAFSPTLLFGAITGVTLLGMIAYRTGTSLRVFAGLLVVGSLVGGVVVTGLLPELVPKLTTQFDRLTATRSIVETRSLIAGQSGLFAGIVVSFGPVLVLGIPYLLWASWRAPRDVSRRWLVLGVYTWYFFALSLVQVRFAGQLALFGAVFAGLGFVHVAAWIDLARPPRLFTDADEESPSATSHVRRGAEDVGDSTDMGLTWPDRRQVVLLTALGLFVCSIGLVVTPSVVTGGSYSEAQHQVADQARSYSTAHDLNYPENYVLSRWGDNRMYNYFVNGESREYGYARQRYSRFGVGTDPEQYYRNVGDRVGFVVIGPGYDSSNRLHDQLVNDYGSRGENDRSGLSHYRVLWTGDSKAYTLVRLVPGATITGEGPPRSQLTVSTQVDIGDRTVDYERRVRTDANGSFSVTVPYPGQYSVGESAVRVSERAVENGSTVSLATNASASSVRPVVVSQKPNPSQVTRPETAS